MIGPLTEGLVGPNGQTLSGAAGLVPDLSCIAMPARPEELQRLLGAISDENRYLTAHVRRLEAELRRSSAELGKLRGAVHDALTDPLTGLANRRAFDLELGAAGARASSLSPAHLVMVDIDHFKRVTTPMGTTSATRSCASWARSSSPTSGATAWSRGWAETSSGSCCRGRARPYAAGVAIRLCQALAARPVDLRGHPEISERITLSIGVAGWQAGDGSDGWYARADAALYQAKRSGRNRICIARALDLKF